MLERIASRTVRPDQVDDALQAVFLGFLCAFDPETATDGDDGAFRYLARSVDNAAGKIVRGETRQRRGLPPAQPAFEEDDPVLRASDQACDPAEIVSARNEVASLLQQLRELPTDQRAALLMRSAGFTPAEIAAELGLSSRQYRKRIERARRLLRG